MKHLILTLALMVFSIPAFAQEHAGHHPASMHLKPIQAEYVCMINNRAFDKPQIPTEVDGKTYYGCCAMCKGKLEKSAAARTAKDPVSGKDIDKATAIIGAAEDGTVYYFETEENMHAFTPASDDHHAEHNDESMPDMQH